MPLSSNFRKVVQISAGVILFFGFISAAVSVTVDQTFMSKPPGEWTEAEALQVLNESPWAHTITATVQDSQCGYDNPVFAGLYSEEQAQRFSSISPTPPSLAVRPDGAEYVVRLLSVKPIQAAAERLISLDEKWAHYRSGYGFEPGSKPTNVNEEHYNPADEITIGIVLKHAGPDRASFRDYAFDEEKHAFPGGGLHHIWPCSGIKTAEGQVTAVGAHAGLDRKGNPSAVHLSFPSSARDGKRLISHANEKMLVRIILNQRLFETTFVVNPNDLLDGTERVLHLLSTVEEPTHEPVP